MKTTTYDTDIIAWAKEQAQLLRSGHFDALDVEHIAEEIEDVGKSEQRELENRMAVLLCHLLKWKYQPERRGSSWEKTIHDQRRMLSMRFKKTPSLKPSLQNEEWRLTVWFDAKIAAEKETSIPFDKFPDECPWTAEQVMDLAFLPD